jgi:hypothetical protein
MQLEFNVSEIYHPIKIVSKKRGVLYEEENTGRELINTLKDLPPEIYKNFEKEFFVGELIKNCTSFELKQMKKIGENFNCFHLRNGFYEYIKEAIKRKEDKEND